MQLLSPKWIMLESFANIATVRRPPQKSKPPEALENAARINPSRTVSPEVVSPDALLWAAWHNPLQAVAMFTLPRSDPAWPRCLSPSQIGINGRNNPL